MSITNSLIALILTIALIALAIWRDSRPRVNGKAHWFSWKPVMMIGAVVVIILVTHLVNSFGVETGRGRF